MAQIRPYIAQVSPQAEIPTRNAQPSDIGGPGVEHLGQSIQQAGYHAAHAQQLLQHQADQQAIRKAHLDLAKIQADTTTDFATFSETVDPSNTNVHGTFWHGGAKEGEVPPNSSPAYKLQWLLDGTQNDAAKAVVQQGAASLSQQFLDRSVSLQVHLAGVAAQQDTNKYVDLQSTRTRVAPGDLPLALRDMRTYIATLPVNEGVKMQLQNQATEEITKNAVYGVIAQAPELALTKLESGDWQGLKQEDRQALMGQAGTAINANKIEARRVEAEKEKARLKLQEDTAADLTATFLLHNANSKEPALTAKKIAQADIKDSDMRALWGLLDSSSQQRALKNDEPFSADLLSRIYLPAGDPRKILSERTLIEAATGTYDPQTGTYGHPHITMDRLNALVKHFEGAKTEDGLRLGQVRDTWLKSVKASVTQSIVNLKLDQIGDQKFGELTQYAASEELRLRLENKDPHSLYNPKSPNFIGNALPNYQRSMQQQVKDVADKIRNAPGLPKTEQGATPPTLQRLPGETPQQWEKRTGR